MLSIVNSESAWAERCKEGSNRSSEGWKEYVRRKKYLKMKITCGNSGGRSKWWSGLQLWDGAPAAANPRGGPI